MRVSGRYKLNKKENVVPIARWDVVPYQRIEQDTTLNLGVVAFSKYGINYVKFTFTDGTNTRSYISKEMTPNSDTASTITGCNGIWEYWATLRADDYIAGNVMCSATVWGMDGSYNILPTLTMIVDSDGSIPRYYKWVATTGNDTTGDGTEGNPYASIAKAATASLTSIGNGTVVDPIIYRGYNTSIGDLESLGRSDPDNLGPLITTGFPLITGAYYLYFGTYHIIQNLNVSSSSTSYALRTNTLCWILRCAVVCTGSGGECLYLGGTTSVCDCDLSVTSATAAYVIISATAGVVYRCRIDGGGAANAAKGLDTQFYAVVGNVIKRCLVGMTLNTTTRLITDNTFYDCGIAIQQPLAAVGPCLVANNHITDCTDEAFSNLYKATSVSPWLFFRNRTRDVTLTADEIGDWPKIQHITTDTGGAETDFVDATNGDFRLIANAPGKGTGVWGSDIGASSSVKWLVKRLGRLFGNM